MATKIATRRLSCRACGEYVFPGEKFTELTDGKRVEKYCRFCHPEDANCEPEGVDEAERALRQAEDYAAYRAAGCADQYWSDRDAGYAY